MKQNGIQVKTLFYRIKGIEEGKLWHEEIFGSLFLSGKFIKWIWKPCFCRRNTGENYFGKYQGNGKDGL